MCLVVYFLIPLTLHRVFADLLFDQRDFLAGKITGSRVSCQKRPMTQGFAAAFDIRGDLMEADDPLSASRKLEFFGGKYYDSLHANPAKGTVLFQNGRQSADMAFIL